MITNDLMIWWFDDAADGDDDHDADADADETQNAVAGNPNGEAATSPAETLMTPNRGSQPIFSTRYVQHMLVI